MHEFDRRDEIQQLAREVLRGGMAGRRKIDLARLGFGDVDELLQRARGKRRMHDERIRRLRQLRHRREILDRIKGHALIQAGAGDQIRCCEQHGVAVSGRVLHQLGTNIAGGTRAVVDDKLLAKIFAQPLRHHSPDGVGGTAG